MIAKSIALKSVKAHKSTEPLNAKYYVAAAVVMNVHINAKRHARFEASYGTKKRLQKSM